MIVETEIDHLINTWEIKCENFEKDWLDDCYGRDVCLYRDEKKDIDMCPQPSYSSTDFFNLSVTDDKEFNKFASEEINWYNKKTNIAVYGNLLDRVWVRNMQNVSTDIVACNKDSIADFSIFKIGILTDPLIRFIMLLKYDNQVLVKNVTGHFRGSYICGKQYLKEVLSRNDTWWLEPQIKKYKRLKMNVIFHQSIVEESHKKYQTTSMDIDKFVPWHYGLIPTIDFLKHKDHRLPDATLKEFYLHADRHMLLEESAWEYMKDPELYEILVKKYYNDFKFGKFNTTPRSGTLEDYWNATRSE